MKQDVLNQLTTALRSGEYTQGRTALRMRVDGAFQYCCLGVLTDIAIKSGECPELKWDSSVEHIAGEPIPVTDGEYESFGVLHPNVMAWAGTEFFNPVLTVDGHQRASSYLNDVSGLSFDELADAFEESFGE